MIFPNYSIAQSAVSSVADMNGAACLIACMFCSRGECVNEVTEVSECGECVSEVSA
jgi:hypothetical protein